MPRGQRSPLHDLFDDGVAPARPLDVQLDAWTPGSHASPVLSAEGASQSSRDTLHLSHAANHNTPPCSNDPPLSEQAGKSTYQPTLTHVNSQAEISDVESPHTAIDITAQGTDQSLLASNSPDSEALALDDFARDLCRLANGMDQMNTQCALLGSSSDSHEHRARLNALADSVKERIEMAAQRLRMIKDGPELLPAEHQRLSSLSTDFESQIAQFQRLQTRMLASSQDFVAGMSSRITSPAAKSGISQSPHATTRAAGENADHERDSLLANAPPRQMQAQILGEIEFNQALIAEREQAIREIETTMAEVHELFVDIGLVAHEQQGMLDNIEANIESSAIRTRAGVREIRLARDRQMRRRRRQILCMLLVAFIVFVLVIAIVASL